MPKSDSSAIDTINKNHQKEVEELELINSKLTKDTQRLQVAIKQSEQRTKAALQDQLTLRQRLNKAEEGLSSANAFVTKLLGDIEIEKNQRTDRDELDLKVQELQRALVAKETELTEARELCAATRKLKLELQRAEEYAHSLNEKIHEVSAESEKFLIDIEQLDRCREDLRQKTNEARDMSLQLHSLEAELKEVKQFQAKHKLMEQELNELRIKAEKFPPLIVEIVRLRSSSRAISKTLQEQDKSIITMREKSKSMETEVTRLKAEIRTLRDVESKLKEANVEIKRLQAMVAEMGALKIGAKNAEEERKSLENQFQKLRKHVRQSVSLNAASLPGEAIQPAPTLLSGNKHSVFAAVVEDTAEEAEIASTDEVSAPVSKSMSHAEDTPSTSSEPATQSASGGITMAQRKAALGGFLTKGFPAVNQ